MTNKELTAFFGLANMVHVRACFIKVVDADDREWFYLTTKPEEFSGYMKLMADLGEKVPVIKYHQELTRNEVFALNKRRCFPVLEEVIHEIFSDADRSKHILIGPAKMHKVIVIQRIEFNRKGIEEAFKKDPRLFKATSCYSHPDFALEEARKNTPLVVVSGFDFDSNEFTGESLAKEVKRLNSGALFTLFSSCAYHFKFPKDEAGIDIAIYNQHKPQDFKLLAIIVGKLARGERYKRVEAQHNLIYFRPFTKEEDKQPF